MERDRNKCNDIADESRLNVEETTISIKEAARWLAAMAATDGLFSPSERKLLKVFADRFGLDPSFLYRMAYAMANEIEMPEVEAVNHAVKKGRMFEDFVVKLTADDSRFVRINWSSDKFVDGLYSLDSLMPDLHIRHKMDWGEVEYYIECKYRQSLPDGVLDLTQQLGRYRRMSIQNGIHELFIALGIGGTPSAPERFYLIPSRMIRKDCILHIEYFGKCLCPRDVKGFHEYIAHYYDKRVLKRIGKY